MKNLILYILVGFSLSLSSCSDFLEVDHYDIVSPEGVYTNSENVFKGLVGVYNTLYTQDAYYIKPHIALANLPALDLQADGWDAEMSTHSWGVESKSDFFNQAWKYSYQQVSRANLYLNDLAKIDETVITQEQKEVYEAEARAIRACAYYYLTINFSRVPMLMTGETYATSPAKARPESDADAWKIIRDDFEFAADKLDWKPEKGMIGRFTKGAALAYAAKVNMYLKNYEKAKEQYKKIINDGPYQLNPCFAMTSWVDNEGSEEAVWEVSFPKFPKMGWDIWSYAANNDCRYFGMQTKAREYGGWGDSFTSYEFVRSFEPGDKRLFYSVVGWSGKGDLDHSTGKPKGDENPFTGDQIGNTLEWQEYFLSSAEFKPNNHSLKWWKVNDVYSSYSVNLYRYTGILLDYAECCFRTSDEAEGWKVLNDIRNRAWGNLEVNYNPEVCPSYLQFPKDLLNDEFVIVPDAKEYYSNYKLEKGYSADVWMVALMQERRKEFHMEFSLYYDLIRCDMIEEWLNCEYPKNNGASFYNIVTRKYYVATGINKNEPWENASESERVNMIPVTPREWDWNPNHRVYPIPVSELTANPLMKQNEGY